MFSDVMTCTGLGVSESVRRMLEPVTITRWTSEGAAAVAAPVSCADADAPHNATVPPNAIKRPLANIVLSSNIQNSCPGFKTVIDELPAARVGRQGRNFCAPDGRIGEADWCT